MNIAKFSMALIGCGLVLASLNGVQAQGAGRGRRLAGQTARSGAAGQHQGGKLAELLKQLNLTDAQKGQIKPIELSAAKQVKAIEQNTALSVADKKTQVKAVHKDTREKVLAILTPEQKQKLKELMKAAHNKKGVTPGVTPAAPGTTPTNPGTTPPAAPGAN